MPKKCFTPEQIVTELKQIEVWMSQGKKIMLACKGAAFSLAEWELSLYNTAISA